MYTFIYCMMHDDGCIITGNHDYVPEGYKMQHATNCESCDWYNMGIITNKFDIIKAVRINYDRFGGGFTFAHYVDTLTDETGNTLVNEVLDDWIRDIYEEHSEEPNDMVFLEKAPILTVKPILVNDLTGEETPFGDETGTPQFYMVTHTLMKYLKDENIYIYIDHANPEWFSIAGASEALAESEAASEALAESEAASEALAENYRAIIEQIYEVNTLNPIWPEHCPSSHIKFEIIYY
jgi:hypothetical protein